MPNESEARPLRPADRPAAAEPCEAGPFAPERRPQIASGLLGTGLLVMYPVVASVVIVISGIMLAGSSTVA